MHLNLVYGTGLTFEPPKSEKNQDILRILHTEEWILAFRKN